MAERINTIVYETPSGTTRVEGIDTTLFATGPGEFICSKICEALGLDPVWSTLFGDRIDSYKRMDYSIRELPALRIYNNTYRKMAESWFIEGSIVADIIFPPAIRRKKLEQIPDTVAAALLQQFRRPTFFENLCAVTPGLNQLGRTFDVDKALAFDFGENTLAPLTQVLINFKLDLRAWDDYLTSDYRTKDEPFARTLEDLARIVTTIQGLEADNETVGVEVDVDQDQT